jgi:hypothetical protein
MTFREEREKEWAAEGFIPSHEIGSRGFVEMLTVERRNGTRRGFSWARFAECGLEENGDLVLFFGEREVVLHGLNLRELWDHINERDLLKVWELPADYVPPATLSKRRVCIFKIELRDTAGHCAASPANEPPKPREQQMTMARLRA